MKKLFIIILLLQCSASISAQGSRWLDKLYLDGAMVVTSKSKGFTTIGPDFQLGYKFIPSVYAFVAYNGGISLYKKDGVKDYFKSENLGGGLGYRYYLNGVDKSSLDFKASVTTSVGSVDWKNTTYSVGAYYRLPSRGVGVEFGLGYRYMDSRTTGISSRGGIFGSIGFSF